MESVSPGISVSRSGPVLHIHLDRAEKRNAITRTMYEAMADALAEGDSDRAVRVILVSGAGEAFCAGNDLNDFLAGPPSGTEGPGFRFLRAISTAKKVQVAAIHGSAVGVGTTMLLHCDFVFAAPSTRLSLPFVNLGLVPEAASTLLLPRIAGHLRAMELLLLGEPIDAATALQWGLVTRVIDEDSLMDAATELAMRISALPPSAARLTKQLVKDDRTGIQLRIEQEGAIFAAQLRSPEFQEAGAAFFEKRKADFSRFEAALATDLPGRQPTSRSRPGRHLAGHNRAANRSDRPQERS